MEDDIVRVAMMGRMGAGKSVSADYLVQEYGFKKASLAAPVKEIASLDPLGSLDPHLQAWAEELLPDPIYAAMRPIYIGEETHMNCRQWLAWSWWTDFQESESRRELLQRIGTDSGRRVNPEIWINYFARNLPDGDIVVDDLRFKNEFYALKKLGFICIKLHSNSALRMHRLLNRDGSFDGDLQEHDSETDLDHIAGDYEIINGYDGLKSLYIKISRILAGEGVIKTYPSTLNNLADMAYDNALVKGFHDLYHDAPDINTRDSLIATKIALIHSELSELLQEHRSGRDENLAEELADVLIRCFDFAGLLNIDLDAAVRRKMEKNGTRPAMHGKRY